MTACSHRYAVDFHLRWYKLPAWIRPSRSFVLTYASVLSVVSLVPCDEWAYTCIALKRGTGYSISFGVLLAFGSRSFLFCSVASIGFAFGCRSQTLFFPRQGLCAETPASVCDQRALWLRKLTHVLLYGPWSCSKSFLLLHVLSGLSCDVTLL